MAKKTYTVVDDPAGIQWVSDRLRMPAEKGAKHELDLTAAEEKAVVAAGWLIPKEEKEKK